MRVHQRRQEGRDDETSPGEDPFRTHAYASRVVFFIVVSRARRILSSQVGRVAIFIITPINVKVRLRAALSVRLGASRRYIYSLHFPVKPMRISI